MMTPKQCARRCDTLIKKLCPPEEHDKYRAYAARAIERVMDPPRDESEFLNELAALLAQHGGTLR